LADHKTGRGCPCQEMAARGMELSPACLGELWLFRNLSPPEMEALMARAVRTRHRSGEVIFHQGEEARRIFFLKGGRVKLSKVTPEGYELTVDIRKAGDSLGENLLNDEASFPFTATCLEETLTCGLTRAGFEGLVLEHPNIGLQVIRTLSQRIDRLTARVGSMALTNLEERLLEILLQMAREHGTREGRELVLDVPLTHEDLGFLVGAHRVSVTRAMKGLRSSGRLIQRGRSWVLPV